MSSHSTLNTWDHAWHLVGSKSWLNEEDALENIIHQNQNEQRKKTKKIWETRDTVYDEEDRNSQYDDKATAFKINQIRLGQILKKRWNL